jgi:hypothetical protein
MHLRVHVSMCRWCRAYKRQVEAIDRLLRAQLDGAMPEQAARLGPLRLSAVKAEQIKRLLQAAAGDDAI